MASAFPPNYILVNENTRMKDALTAILAKTRRDHPAWGIAMVALHGHKEEPCHLCDYVYDKGLLGLHGCPNCGGEGLDDRQQKQDALMELPRV